MNTWALVWLIVFAAAALLFFAAALIITIVGASDLKDLLTNTGRPRNTTSPLRLRRSFRSP